MQLIRTTDAKPSEWTVAGGLDLVNQSSQQTTVLGTPTFSSYSIQHPVATLAAGAYAVLVSNYAAFEERYNPTGTANILVLGVYSGSLNNGGDTVDIYQVGTRADRQRGGRERLRALLPGRSHQLPELVSLADQARRRRPGLDADPCGRLRQRRRSTGGRATWVARPARPTWPTGQLGPVDSGQPGGPGPFEPDPEINLTWSASSEPRSYVAYYVIDRNGTQLGTSTTTSYADTTAVAGKNYTYYGQRRQSRRLRQPAIEFDRRRPARRRRSYDWMDTQDIEIYFSEPLTSATATVLGHYAISGGLTFTAVALSRNGTKVTLTTNQAVSTGTAYTITMTGLATVSGDPLPASLPLSVTYQAPTGNILLQVWDGLDSNTAVNDLTSPALNPNYPNNPTYTTYLTSFDAPYNTSVTELRRSDPGLRLPAHYRQLRVLDRRRRHRPVVALDEFQPARRNPICYVSSATGHDTWSTYATQQSTSISLVAGQRYYIEALMKQAANTDNLSVAWMPPGTGTSLPPWDPPLRSRASPTAARRPRPRSPRPRGSSWGRACW